MLSGHVVIGQGFTDQQLRGLEDEELLSLFNEVGADSIRQERIARVYLDRGRKQKDTIKMARGYDRLARIFHPEKNIRFADSVIALTKDMDHITYPALGYMIKGCEFNILNDLESTSENFILLYETAKKNNNLTHQVFALDNLIYFKSIWGNKKDALDMQKQRHDIILNQDFLESIVLSSREGIDYDDLYIGYQLVSLQNFAFCYLNLQELDLAKLNIDKGVELLKTYNGEFNNPRSFFSNWFLEASMEIDYYKGDYESSIKKSDSLFKELKGEEKVSTLVNINFFKGLSYKKLNNYSMSMQYLKIADSLVEKNNYTIHPYQHVLYENLLDYYKQNNNIGKQLKYLNKLIQVDSIFIRNYQYFDPNLIKNFETPGLLAEKEILISNLTKKNHNTNLFGWTSVVLFILSLSGLFYYFKRQQLFKKRFELLMEQGSKPVMVLDNVEKKNEISSEVIKEILDQLDVFEQSDEYISQDINLHELAKLFGTNSRYLSRIINLEKEKNFSQYINELRLDYALKELSENPVFRKYTIKAIANECGFNRAEVFSKAFYKKFGIYPSFYLKKLEARKQKS